jgi:hypothetical protein
MANGTASAPSGWCSRPWGSDRPYANRWDTIDYAPGHSGRRERRARGARGDRSMTVSA